MTKCNLTRYYINNFQLPYADYTATRLKHYLQLEEVYWPR